MPNQYDGDGDDFDRRSGDISNADSDEWSDSNLNTAIRFDVSDWNDDGDLHGNEFGGIGFMPIHGDADAGSSKADD